MKYATFDESGVLITRYNSAVHGNAIPQDAVEISEDIFCRSMVETDGVWMRDPETGIVSKQELAAPSRQQLIAKVLVEVKAVRAELYKLADGLQGTFNQRALALWMTPAPAGEEELAAHQAALAVAKADMNSLETYKQGLRDITATDLSAATTEAEMRYVFSAAYKTLKDALPAAVKMKFYQTLQ